MTVPRLFVVTSPASPHAVILRRGPSGQVASLGWNRDTDEVVLGQWLKGRIHEFRCDLSPDGQHFVYFAGNGNPDTPSGGWWTAVSRAPYLHALHFFPQDSAWHGGGAFTVSGECWLNGFSARETGTEVTFCDDLQAYPHSTDGFWMGDLYASRQIKRGWVKEGSGYDVILRKPIKKKWMLRWWVETGQENRSLVAGRYALDGPDGQSIDLPDWDWADLWQGELRVGSQGRLTAMSFRKGTLRELRVIHDSRDMVFEHRRAPYDTGAPGGAAP